MPRSVTLKATKGRYAEDPVVKRLRIQTWFRAVSHVSGLTAAELERRYSLDEHSSNRSCIWDKYRRGDVEPRDAGDLPDSVGLVTLVESCYGETRQWLRSPLWRLADRAPLDMLEIRVAYEGLPELLRSMFIAPKTSESQIFWRRPVDIAHACEILRRFGTIEALITSLIVVREAEITQNQLQHACGVKLARECVARLAAHPVIGPALLSASGKPCLGDYLESRWIAPGYTHVAEDA